MSHDAWAAFSAVELARNCQDIPANWFSGDPPWEYQTFATRDPSSAWPHPDAAVEVAQLPTGGSHLVAIEFKRSNEGIHGVLTGMGQVQAYIHKGFSASVLVLPSKYENLEEPGQYVSSVLERSAPHAPVGIFTYEEPDLAMTSPFAGRLRCYRSPKFDLQVRPQVPRPAPGTGRQRTQWAHVREGSTVPDPLFRYLQATRDVSSFGDYIPLILPELRAAVERVAPGANPAFYLSNTSPHGRREFADAAWRRFWFEFIVTLDVQRIWHQDGDNVVQDASETRLRRWDGTPVVFFARSDTIKARLTRELNAGTLNPDQAWEEYARKVRERAHQFREDVDSGAEAAGFIDADGRLTELGFRFVNSCERSRGANSPEPLAIMRWALLTNGGFLALLHYIHSISDRIFREDELRFVEFLNAPRAGKRSRFQSVEYRQFLLDELSNSLRVAGRSARRPGRQRPALEGEFITLRKLGLIGNFRTGVGLEINWPAVHGALEIERT